MHAVVRLTHYQRPIIALTSQVGEVAVVRTPVSYKCGWGSNKTNPHPNLPQLGKECACVAQLTYSPRPIGESGFADGAGETAKTATPPDSERIESAGALLRRRNSESAEQIQDREQLFLSRQAKVTDAGEGLNINRTITHPSLPSYREGTRAVAQLAHSRRIVNFCNNFSKNPKVFAQFCRNT